MGEITVLGIVALTVFALLRRFRPAPDTIQRPEQQLIQRSYDEAEPDRRSDATASDYLYVPSIIMQWMFPVVIVLAAYLFLRGHDAPGGGFVAGVAMASSSSTWRRERCGWRTGCASCPWSGSAAAC
jgi:multicomponent K+:H+ antiporter subunit A